MKKLIVLASLACLMAVGGSASAQIICEWNATFDTNGGVPVNGSSGSYHIILSQAGAVYTVVVVGNVDGNAATSFVPGTANPPGLPVPKSGAGTLSFNFHAVGGGDLFVTPITQSSTAYTGVPLLYGGFPANFGGPNNVAYGSTGGAAGPLGWTAAPSFTLTYNAFNSGSPTAEPVYLSPRGDLVAGSSVFTGSFTLAAGTIASVDAAFQDSGQHWSGNCGIVPEGSALAMALPGLLPLGFMLRRRRMKASA